MLNSIGLQNPGVDAVIEKYARDVGGLAGAGHRQRRRRVGRGLRRGRAPARRRARASPASSSTSRCPNVGKGGLQFAIDAGAAGEVTAAVRRATDLPLLVKLSPNVADIRPIARAIADAGADALTAINTLSGIAVAPGRTEAALGNIYGGLSGPAIKPVALRIVYEVAQAVKIPVVAIGGVTELADVLDFLAVGRRRGPGRARRSSRTRRSRSAWSTSWRRHAARPACRAIATSSAPRSRSAPRRRRRRASSTARSLGRAATRRPPPLSIGAIRPPSGRPPRGDPDMRRVPASLTFFLAALLAVAACGTGSGGGGGGGGTATADPDRRRRRRRGGQRHASRGHVRRARESGRLGRQLRVVGREAGARRRVLRDHGHRYQGAVRRGRRAGRER